MISSSPTLENFTKGESSNSGQWELETIVDQGEIIERLDKQDLKRYSRRDKTEMEKAIVLPTQCQKSSSSLFDELFQSCTKHFISNFLSYDACLPPIGPLPYLCFFVSILEDWREAVKDPKWKREKK